ncbi:hypothetical protein AB6Q85_003293 [Vibrio cholerae]
MNYHLPQTTLETLTKLSSKLGVSEVDLLNDFLTHPFNKGDLENFSLMAKSMREQGDVTNNGLSNEKRVYWPPYQEPELSKLF